jgi:hypothetical protein
MLAVVIVSTLVAPVGAAVAVGVIVVVADVSAVGVSDATAALFLP